MNARGAVTGRLIATAALLLAYALLAHYSNSRSAAPALGATLAIAPLLLVGVIAVWRTGAPLSAAVLGLVAGALVYRYREFLEERYVWIYLWQQCGAYLLLSYSFGRTLKDAHTPLCTRFAAAVHGPLAPAVLTYTRRVTAAWAIFFACMALLLVILFFVTPLRIWSLFANFCTAPLIALMFLAEYAIRRQVLPPLRRSNIFDAVQAYLNSERDSAASRR